MNGATEYPKDINANYQSRRDALGDGLDRSGWDVPRPGGTMFVWAPIPEPYKHMGSVEFAKMLVTEAHVATSPGVGFGPGGEGHIRFALIENDHGIQPALPGLKQAPTGLDQASRRPLTWPAGPPPAHAPRTRCTPAHPPF